MNNYLNEIFSVLGGGLGGVILTHLFYKSKLKKEQKIRFQNEVGDRIAKSLIEVRDIELKADVIEVYDIENQLESRGSNLNIFESSAIYPAIMHDKQSLIDFINDISFARYNYEKDLDCQVAAYLLYIERYLSELSLFLSDFDEDAMPTLGTIFIADIQKWQRSFDNILVKKINSHPTKFERHHGFRWKLEKNRTRKKLYYVSILYRLKSDYKSDIINLARGIIESVKEEYSLDKEIASKEKDIQ
ncbi:hypothetical protein [Oceanobacillus kapialis]|uniref:Uncharacterized protein n=1 Tax=Oceanobacillus kapialis TaxID=481353 RepID=A0ABW5Q032_9BACI